MRLALTLAAVLMIAARVNADDSGDATKQPPTDDKIIAQVGDRLAKVFARFGTPEDVWGNKGKEGILSYWSFAFAVKDKTITACFFAEGSWKGTVRGIKFGDTREQVVKTLGGNYTEVKGADFNSYGWELKEQNAKFWVYFDKDNKVNQMEVTLQK
jgi:hypothetical protein